MDDLQAQRHANGWKDVSMQARLGNEYANSIPTSLFYTVILHEDETLLVAAL